MSGGGIPTKKAAGSWGTLRLLIGDIPGGAGSIDNDVIDHTQIASVYVINMDASAGFDRSFDHFAVLVHNVTRPLENITARSIRTVLANNESFDRLVIGRRPLLSRPFHDRSGYRYWLCCGSCCLSLMCRTRLGKRHRRNECAAGENNDRLLYH